MNIAISKTGAEKRAGPDGVAMTGVDRDTGGAKIRTVVRRCDGSHEPEDEETGIDCELRPSIPGKEMGRGLWTRGRDEIDDHW